MPREIKENELQELLELYLHLHEESVPEMSKHLKDTWNTIVQDKNHHIIVKEADGKTVCFFVVGLFLTIHYLPQFLSKFGLQA